MRYEQKRLGILGLTLGAVGFIGALASVYSYGVVGLVVTVLAVGAVFAVCYLVLSPVLAKNDRGVTVLDAIKTVGLIDVEIRNELYHALPPASFYKLAKREIVITGASAYLTFQQDLAAIRLALADGIRVYVMIFHPEGQDAEWYTQLDRQDIKSQIYGTIYIIKQERLDQHKAFHIRFVDKTPTFRSVMIDGDVEPTGQQPKDEDGQIRVQPYMLFGTGKEGIVFQFRKKEDHLKGGFDYFADDVRSQWARNGRIVDTFFERVY